MKIKTFTECIRPFCLYCCSKSIDEKAVLANSSNFQISLDIWSDKMVQDYVTNVIGYETLSLSDSVVISECPLKSMSKFKITGTKQD